MRAIAAILIALALAGCQSDKERADEFMRQCNLHGFNDNQCVFLEGVARINSDREAANGMATGLAIGLAVSR